ncbi:ferritin family protein [Candidatus Woesearchaeota archaeon]|nr:ferritin family protein [Candidatus Woesearchaeota archaeon]
MPNILTWILYAIETEDRGLKLYQYCAEHVNNPGARDLFGLLIQEETEHKKALAKLLKNTAKSDEEIKKAEEEFKKMKIDVPLFTKADLKKFTGDAHVPDMFNTARDLEEKGKKFYTGLAGKAKIKEAKDLFAKLAKDEKKHKEKIVFLGLSLF